MNNKVTDINKVMQRETFTFAEMIPRLLEGKAIRRLEWKDPGFYGMISDGKLLLHKPDNKFYN